MRNIVLLVSSLLLTFNSFSQDNLDVDYFVKGKKDKNGYTHIKLNWDGEYWPRFTIGLYADTQDKEYWYNGSPVITSVASSKEEFSVGEYGMQEVVQSTKMYYNLDPNVKDGSKAYTKRVVGPFPPEMKGKPITIYVSTSWDLGGKTHKIVEELKFIVK